MTVAARRALAAALAAAAATSARDGRAEPGPDTVRARVAIVRPARARDARDGHVELTLVVRDRDAAGTLPDALVAGRVSIAVEDAGGFRTSARLGGCARTRAPHRVVCRADGGRVRAHLARPATRAVYRLAVTLARIPGGAGTAPLRGPVRVRLAEDGGNAPGALAVACVRRGRGLACRDARGPNLIVVATDDQRWDTLDYMPTVRDRLAGEGVRFTNAYVTTALCCPSRASLLSGLYVHDHGVVTNGDGAGGAAKFVGRDRSTIATWLHDAGYRTGLFGKYLNSYSSQGPPAAPSWYVPPGWDVWDAFAEPRSYGYVLVRGDGSTSFYRDAPADYATDVLAAHLLAFVTDSLRARRRFFAYFAPFAPHVETRTFLPEPAPRHRDAPVPPLLLEPPSFDETDVTDKPAEVRNIPPFDGLSEIYAAALRQLSYRATLAVDEAIAAVLRAIAAAGAERDTVVLYTSDNGVTWGEHRLLGKERPYEECHRVPLVVWAPGVVGAPRVEPGFALNVDVAPTLAELAGVLPPTPVDGGSLVPALTATGGTPHADVLLEDWNADGAPHYVGIRSPQWKLVDHPATHEAELYDERADVWELDNRSGDPAYEGIARALRSEAAALATPLAP